MRDHSEKLVLLCIDPGEFSITLRQFAAGIDELVVDPTQLIVEFVFLCRLSNGRLGPCAKARSECLSRRRIIRQEIAQKGGRCAERAGTDYQNPVCRHCQSGDMQY